MGIPIAKVRHFFFRFLQRIRLPKQPTFSGHFNEMLKVLGRLPDLAFVPWKELEELARAKGAAQPLQSKGGSASGGGNAKAQRVFFPNA